MMGKAIVGEATARQAVSFVLGAAAALTLVVLVRAPVAGLWTHGQFSGWRSCDEQYHRHNGTARTVHQAPSVAEAGDDHHPHQQADTTLKVNTSSSSSSSSAAATTTAHAAAVRSDLLPSRDHQEQGAEEAEEFRGLTAAVSRAAMDDGTVIITCVNQGWVAPGSLLDLFLESFRIGDGTARLLPHVLVVALDPAAHARCLAVHRHCYQYTIPGMNPDLFGHEEWLDLVWSKVKLQRRVLELGYGFLFTDVDIMWLRDPFKHVTAYADMTISSDDYFGDPDNLDNLPNTGFFHVKPNRRTIAMTRLWHESRARYPDRNEQPVFNAIKPRLVAELGVRLQYLDPVHMGGFCSYGKDLGKIVTMHANCCVGLEKKMRDLRGVLDDWRNYTSLPSSEKHRAKWTVPGACIK